MKFSPFPIVLFASVASVSLSSKAHAALLAYDGFSSNYTVGGLGSQAYDGTGFAVGGNWGTDGSFTAGGLTHPTLVTTTGVTLTTSGAGNPGALGNLDVSGGGAFDSAGLVTNGSVGGAGNTGTVYYSFLAQPTATGGWAGLNLYNNGTENLGVGKNGGSTNFSVFQPNADIGTPATPVDLTTHLFVVRVDYGVGGNDDIAQIWLDPDPTLSEAAQAAGISSTTTADDQAFTNIRMRGDGASWNYDEVRFGTTWADVTPTIPEPTSLGLLSVAALAMFRRRRS